MKILKLTLKNFRGIKQLTVDFREQTNIITGVNASGKTSLLDCIAIMLSRLIGRFRSTGGTGRKFSEQDIKNDANETVNAIKIEVFDSTVKWKITKSRRGHKRKTMSQLKEMRTPVRHFRHLLETDLKANLPVVIYYPVNRSVLDIPLRIRKKHPFDQLSIYDLALTGVPNSFRIFFEWFREREDLENEYRIEDHAYRDIQLQAIRTAIYSCLPDFSKLKIKRSPLRMTAIKKGKEFNIKQLSDGEKCVLALVGDMARRLAIANPSLTNPLEGAGVILIDEIDLHLHPAWQRKIIPAMEKTFPNCQFVVTTHSPQIFSHVRPLNIFMLNQKNNEIIVEHPEGSFGLDSNYILEVNIGVARRNPEVMNRIERLFEYIANDEFETADAELELLHDDIGSDPELVKADLLMRRQKVLNQ